MPDDDTKEETPEEKEDRLEKQADREARTGMRHTGHTHPLLRKPKLPEVK